ncbi:High-osmolarity-induced transcription 1 [Fusarium acutatum]|uniref:High-osmolarity-induced transcription 1 n=1 Tax=Fusarium acutatum TaxID=78861 RepID=A0A8H4K514_9HYPO|nr:High-osmolarity-induced transcription 1 [Fusarium acutatum]
MSQPICKKQPMMLISPNETPATSRSASEGPLRRSASEPCQNILPIRRKSPELVAPLAREEGIEQEVGKVPMSLARVVVNMQEHYTAELEAERQRTEELARQNDEMMRKMGEMERRLQMHVVLMDGFVGFMRNVKEGKFATGGGAEMEIARAFGGEHLDEVRGLVAENYMPVQQSVEGPATEPMVFGDEDEPHEIPAVVRHVSFDESPSTPDLEAPPVRSTGRRAPKRKNPPLRPHREVKRQTRANLRSVRLRNTSSWTAINTRNSPYAGADLSNEEDKDLDFTPDLEVDEDDEEGDEEQGEVVEEEVVDDSDDEMEDIPNAPATPSPSLSDEDLETTKTRYSVPAPSHIATPVVHPGASSNTTACPSPSH